MENAMNVMTFDDACNRICEVYCKHMEEYYSYYSDPDDADYHLVRDYCMKCPMQIILNSDNGSGR